MSRAIVEEVDHAFRGGDCWDEVNLKISALPTDLIVKIFLHSNGKTIGRGRCISRDWYNRLNRADNMVTHFKSEGGKVAILHLDNPLKNANCRRLSMFLFRTRVAVPVAAPLDWTWFSMVGTDTSKSLIPDLGSDGYHFNHREEWSAYAFLSMVGCDDYKILSLTKRHLATPGYDMQMFLSSAGQWSLAVLIPPVIDRLSSGFGVHVMTINLRPIGAMAWGRHIFIGATNLTETPCLKIGRELIGISHCVRDFDGVESSLDAVVSEAQFRSIGLTDGVVKFIGRVRRPGVVCIKGCMGLSLEV
ncbi:hypothetical protein AHAS_Ahas01G0135100 [Arachis hypogaea]